VTAHVQAPDETEVGPLLREDFPALPPGCEGWVLRSGRSTLYLASNPDTDWDDVLEFLNQHLCCWRITPNTGVAS
jgi:hypothetical protein